MSEASLFGGGINPIGTTDEFEAPTYTVCVSGSYEPPGQLVPPFAVPTVSVASGPPTLLMVGGVNTGPILYRSTTCSASSRSAGVKLIKSSMEIPFREYAGGLLGNGCVGEYHSPGTSPFSTGRSSMGHTGWPFTRSKTYNQPCFVG